MDSISQDATVPRPLHQVNGQQSDLAHGVPEPIVVIGFSLKLPGDASSTERFWKMLLDGRAAMSEFPSDRINLKGHYHPDASRLDELPVRGGHFIDEKIDRFDAPFFLITPAEAACMEPQQRGMLETAYRALENAGITIQKCSGTRTSVHTGSFTDDYRSVLFQDPLDGHTYAASGLSSSMLANRISWFFNLKGPSMNLDTACSSSLTSLHLACQDLRNGTTDMGLVGGCNLFYHPDYMKIMSNMGFLSPDSRSWSLDEKANGYARGEGFGMCVVKRLSDAARDGDTIRGIIRATGLNQDGRTPGITVPNGEAHRALIRETYAKANLDMEPTRFFEAHATGTQAGDPVEANAVGECFSHVRSASDPLWIGAVKSNIGHLEAGSGMASLFKCILVLESGVIPPNAGFESLNKRIFADRYHLAIPTEARPWPSHGLRRICINSFGFGGSNAVVVLDDAYHYSLSRSLRVHHCTKIEPPTKNELGDSLKTNVWNQNPRSSSRGLLVWSSVDQNGIKRMQSRLSSFFDEHSDHLSGDDIKDVAYTLGRKRSRLSWRSSIAFSSLADLRDKLTQALSETKSSQGLNSAFIFTGQGAQYAGMGRDLMAFTVFRQSIEDSKSMLKSMGCDWQLEAVMFSPENENQINGPEYSQPCCTALQIALVDLLRSFGVRPVTVVGHSSGEIAAAYCTGALIQTDALKIAYHRGRLAAKLRTPEDTLSMMAAGVSSESVGTYLEHLEARFGTQQVDLACINSPSNVTLSGNDVQLAFLEEAIQKDGFFARRLHIDIAYHSRFMDPIAMEYHNCLSEFSIPPELSEDAPVMVSSVTGDVVHPSDLRSAAYWVRNMTSPVQFSQATSRMIFLFRRQRKVLGAKNANSTSRAISDMLEIGPHSALRGPVRESLQALGKDTAIRYHATLVRNSSRAAEDLMSISGKLWSLGHAVDIVRANNLPNESRTIRTDLPEYSYQHSQSYWLESRIGKNYRLRDTPRHDFLGVKSSDWNELQACWRDLIGEQRLPWLREHKLAGEYLYPAGGMISMAIEAARQLTNPAHPAHFYELRDVRFLNAFRTMRGDAPAETRFSMSPDPQSPRWLQFHLFVFEETGCIEICRGQIRTHREDTGSEDLKPYLRRWKTSDFLKRLSLTEKSFTTKELYDRFAATYDAEYGPTFQTLHNISLSATGEVMADINTRKWAEEHGEKYVSPHVIHPATIDGLFQLVFPATEDNVKKTLVPTRVGRIWVNAKGLSQHVTSIRVMGRCLNRGHRGTDVRARVVSPNTNEPLIDMENYEATIISRSPDAADDEAPRKLCANMVWRPDLETVAPQSLQKFSELNRQITATSFYHDLHLVIRYFLWDAIRQLDGVNLQTTCTAHAQNLVRWIKYQLSKVNVRGNSDAEERMISDESFRAGKLQDTKQFSAEGRVLTTLAENICGIIRGQVDSVQLLFEGTLASDYYQQLMSGGPIISSLTKYLDLMGHKNPGMSILEIGAGTGSSAQAVTKALTQQGRPRWSHYDYTDVSPGFFPEAQRRFSKFSHCMSFKVLDGARDPLQQGFSEASYDLIVAGNVLHALQDLPNTLRNIRKLMKPDGKLVLLETTSPDTIRAGLYGGVLKDWWNSIKDEEKCTPLLSIDSWNSVLRETGFNGLDLTLKDFEDPEFAEQSILVTSASPSGANGGRLLCHDTTRLTIFTDDQVPAQKILASSLRCCLSRISHVTCECFCLGSAMPADLSNTLCISLLEVDKPLLADLTEEFFIRIKHMVTNSKALLWVSQTSNTPPLPGFFMIEGFARVILAEHPLQKLVTLVLESRPAAESISIIVDVLARMSQTEDGNTEFEYRQHNGLLEVPRVIHADSMSSAIAARSKPFQTVTDRQIENSPPLELRVDSPGLVESVCYHELVGSQLDKALEDDEVCVRIHALGFGPRDFLVASGKLNEVELGMQSAGMVEAAGAASGFNPGDRVCVAIPAAFRTFIRCKAGHVIKTPGSMSLPEAASLTVPAMQAVQSLMVLGRLQAHETILIHDAASTAGQVLAQVALGLNCHVLCAVRSTKQREELRKVYGISEQNIFLKVDMQVLGATDDLGIDVIVTSSSTSDEELEASCRCLSDLGRFVYISDGLEREVHIPENQRGTNTSFSRINMADLVRGQPAYAAKLLTRAGHLLQDGTIRSPAGMRIFGAGEVKDALDFFGGRGETGNSVVDLTIYSLAKMTLAVQPLHKFDANSTYIIAGGLGGLGRTIARWMVGRGARNLVLLSRSGASKPAARALIDELSQQGANIAAPTCDIADLGQLQRAVEDATRTMPPIRGCIQAAMLLRDAVFEKMTYSEWHESVRPKVQGSWNLHLTMPKGLDFFVLLSSVSAIIGGVSQSNYAAGNAYMDSLCRYRRDVGELTTKSINLGMVVSEGVVAETEGLLASLRGMGQMMEIDMTEFFALLEYVCDPQMGSDVQDHSDVPGGEGQIIFGVQVPSAFGKKGLPGYLTRPMFRHFYNEEGGKTAGEQSRQSALVDFAAAIAQAETMEQVVADIVRWFMVKMANLLGVTAADIDTARPISSYGIDSLMGMELRNWLERELGAKMPIFELLSSGSSIADICQNAARRTRFRTKHEED